MVLCSGVWGETYSSADCAGGSGRGGGEESGGGGGVTALGPCAAGGGRDAVTARVARLALVTRALIEVE